MLWTCTPNAATRKPAPKQQAATNMALRGPTRSIQVPNSAADAPSTAKAMLNTQPTVASAQSSGAEWVMPMSLVSGALKTE